MKKPHKNARKLIIEDWTWWWLVADYEVIIWDPRILSGYRKSIFKIWGNFGDPEDEGLKITPFKIRNFIDCKLRGVPKEKIDKRINDRKVLIMEMRAELMFKKAQEVLEHAKQMVTESNYRAEIHSHYGFIEKNNQFLEDLREVLAYYIANHKVPETNKEIK